MTDLLQGEKKKPFGVPPAFLYGSFLLPLPCLAIASGDGGTPSSFSKNSCVTFVFCFAKSESGNRQRGAPMRQQIKGRVERPRRATTVSGAAGAVTTSGNAEEKYINSECFFFAYFLFAKRKKEENSFCSVQSRAFCPTCPILCLHPLIFFQTF